MKTRPSLTRPQALACSGALLALLARCGGQAVSDGGQGGAAATEAAGGYWTGPQSKTSKVDLLLVVDNSLGMSDAQVSLEETPRLVTRLVDPNCVGPGGETVPHETPGACPAGASFEYPPVQSLHVGIITSSLGARGKPCAPGSLPTVLEDDRAHLMGPDRNMDSLDAVISYDTGSGNVSDLENSLVTRLRLVGEQGCGFESSLEAWYRFLVDPEPPSEVVLDSAESVARGRDDTLLAQRAQFLRPDSALVIVVLSDENDCSMIDYGQGWLVAGESRLPRGTSACSKDPNDRCCFSCRMAPAEAPAGCPGPVGSSDLDPSCQQDAGEGYGPGVLSAAEDAASLRCWETKRRLGFDFLFPVQRYVDGLTKASVATRQKDASGKPVMAPNPLFAQGRDPSLVTLAGIVGVPWQDLATSATLDAATHALELMDFDALAAADRWKVILGDPGASPPVSPADPFMRESVDARTGSNPVTGQPIVDASSTNPAATINGHEFNAQELSFRDALQYACIYQLPVSRDCTLPEYTTNDPALKKGCDCKTATENRNRAVCNPPGGGGAGTQQYSARALPGLRHLELLEGLGPRGVVGSICAKFPKGDPADPAYAYRPVEAALMRRIGPMLE